jgi:hypothetical protein
MRPHRPLVALLSVAALAACDKNELPDLTGPVPSAEIRFFNFGVNAPSVQFYAGDRKMSATTSASCQSAQNPPVTATDSTCLTIGIQAATGIAYGSPAANGLYVGIDPGQYTIAARTASVSTNGTIVSSLPATIETGKRYSYYQSGFYNATTKTADAFLVEDDFPAAIDWTASLVRFVNAIGNSQPMALVAVNTETGTEYPIGGTIAYKAAGAFTSLPPGFYNLRTRYAGSTTDRIVRTGVPFGAGRVYTITARGDMTVTSSTATNRPILENTANR